MGWLLELVVNVVGDLVGDAVARAIGPWGCAAVIALVALAVLLVVWLT